MPNPSFELGGFLNCDYNTTSTQFLASAIGWDSPTTTTPDVMSTQVNQSCWSHIPFSTYLTCATGCNRRVAVPPVSGNNVGAICVYKPNATACGAGFWLEYLQVQLTSPLRPGWEYEIEFWANLSSNSSIAVNNLGALLRTTHTTPRNCNPIVATPHINSNSPVANTQNWRKISGTIIADSAYQYLIIGNFNYLNTSVIPNSGGACASALYVIDDVSVTRKTSVSIEAGVGTNRLEVYPNPATDKIRLAFSGDTQMEEFPQFVTVWNMTGAKMECPVSSISGQEMELNISDLPAGIYFGSAGTGEAPVNFKFCKL